MRRTARGDLLKSSDQGTETAFSDGNQMEPRDANPSDYLEYVSDMLLDFRVIAEDADAGTLAAILDLAHSEARLQVKLRGKG